MNLSLLPIRERYFLIVFSLLYFFILGWMWHETRGMPGMMDHTETYETYHGAKNFSKFGFFKLKTIHDDATSEKGEAHPHFYTHYPIFPIYLNYALIQVGIKDIRYHHLFAIPILYLGLLFCYFFLRQRVQAELAMFVCGVSLLNYMGVLEWGLNLYRAFTWPLFWGSFYFKDKWAPKKVWPLWLCLFLSFYFDWAFVAFLLFAHIFDWFFSKPRYSLKTLGYLFLVPLLVGCFVRTVQVGTAIGWKVFFLDLYYTLGNRMLGSPTREFLNDFYQKYSLTLWGYDTKFNFSFIKTMVQLFYERASDVLGFGSVEIPAILVIALGWQKWVKKKMAAPLMKASNLAICLFGGVILYTLLSPLHAFHMFIHPFFPFYVFPLDFAKGLALFSIYLEAKLSAPHLKRVYFGALGMGMGLLGATFYWQIKKTPWEPSPASLVMDKYKGHSFYTNYNAWYTSYFTQTWSGTSWGLLTDDGYFNKTHVNEADKNRVGFDKYDFPDYVLCFNNKFLNPCHISGETFLAYPMVEKGKDFAILNVQKRKSAVSLKLVAPEKEGIKFRRVPAIRVESEIPQHQNVVAFLVDRKEKTGADFFLPTELKKIWGIIQNVGVSFVFEVDPTRTINSFMAVVAKKAPENFFSVARIEASSDKKDWVTLSRFAVPESRKNESEYWWRLPGEFKIRYFRVILSPEPQTGIISLSELGFGQDFLK